MGMGQIVVYGLLGLVFVLLLRRILSMLKGGTPMEDLRALMDQGAIVIDVRSPAEFAGGHIPGSRNIPLDQLGSRSSELDPKQAILLCCASGARSGMAKGMLEKSGFQNVHNAGPWQRLQSE